MKFYVFKKISQLFFENTQKSLLIFTDMLSLPRLGLARGRVLQLLLERKYSKTI